jgi:insulin-like growth factor 2 receptor
LTIGTTNTTVNLGKFSSSPHFNEDIKALELIYDNGFDNRTNNKITTKITLRCVPENLDSPPLLIDIDNALGTYKFEWQTAAACPISSVKGDNCKVYIEFVNYTFDLNQLTSSTYYPIQTDEHEYQINVCGPVKSSTCNEGAVDKVVGPFGACQVEIDGQKRTFILGKANYSLIYWKGIINLTFTEGTPYPNKEKTPRKSQIAFICDPHIGKGHPEFDEERDYCYFFRWNTSLACPHAPKTVH